MTTRETTDEIARNVAYNALSEMVATALTSNKSVAAHVINAHAATWERAVNEHGQPVRRYVLRGAWEVDPEAIGRD